MSPSPVNKTYSPLIKQLKLWFHHESLPTHKQVQMMYFTSTPLENDRIATPSKYLVIQDGTFDTQVPNNILGGIAE
jgi:hypothetical protein